MPLRPGMLVPCCIIKRHGIGHWDRRGVENGVSSLEQWNAGREGLGTGIERTSVGTGYGGRGSGGRTRGQKGLEGGGLDWTYHVFGIFGQQRHGLFIKIRQPWGSSLD